MSKFSKGYERQYTYKRGSYYKYEEILYSLKCIGYQWVSGGPIVSSGKNNQSELSNGILL